jgi:hypothetical protein
MNREDIIRLAKEAGFSTFLDRSNPMWGSMVASHEEIERFAALVVEREREACARVCEEIYRAGRVHGAQDCAAAIRARGEIE